MLSLQNSPVDLDAMNFLGISISGDFSTINQPHGDFSQVLEQLRQDGGELQLQQLSDNPQLLENLDLPADYLKMLQKFLADGKDLPEAAQDILQQLRQEYAGLIQQEVSQQQLDAIQQIHDALESLQLLLPPEDQPLVENGLAEISELIEHVAAELNKVAAQTRDAQESDATQPETDESRPVDSPANAAVFQEVAQDSDAQVQTIKTGSSEQTAVKQQPLPAGMSKGPADTTANLPGNQPQVNEAERYSPRNASDFDAEMQAMADTKGAAEGKQIQLNTPQLTAKTAQAIFNEQAASQQPLARFTGGESSSFANMQSQGGTTSFAQLMSQATPQPLTQNIHRPEWGQALGQRIGWMIGNKLQGAQLRITPAHLGPVDIRISIENNVAQVAFISQHQVVRDALEQAVPRLRDMLESQDLELGDVDISDRRETAQHQTADHSGGLTSGSAENTDMTLNPLSVGETTDEPVVVSQSDSLLDTYA